MADDEQVSSFVAMASGAFSSVIVPSQGAKVHRECAFSFDTPESPEGIFINLASHQAFGKEFVGLDRERALTSVGKMPSLYLRQKWRRVPKSKDKVAEEAAAKKKKEEEEAAAAAASAGQPVLVVPEDASAAWELDKSDVSLVFFLSEDNPHDTDSFLSLAHPSQTRGPASPIPERVLSTIEAVMACADADAALAASSGPVAIEDIREVSRYSLDLVQLDNGVKISPNPQEWKCSVPGCDKNTLEHGLWLNLSDGFIGCGRPQYGGQGGNGHALQHFKDTGNVYPLCVKLGTITPAGGDVYSYAPDEDDMVQDPYLSQHLGHFGINIMRLSKVAKSMAELSVESQQLLEFGRITEEGKELEAVTGPGFIGCDNLGNTCYLNSCVQVIASLPEARELYGSGINASDAASMRKEEVYRTAPQKWPQEDLLTQTSKLFHYLYSKRYALSDDAMARRKEHAAREVGDEKEKEKEKAEDKEEKHPEPGAGSACGFVTPRMFKGIVGKGHPEFITNKQQDVVQFLEWLLQENDKAHHNTAVVASRFGGSMAAPSSGITRLSDLFSFEVQTRLEDVSSGGVRYSVEKDRFLRLNIPLDEATNKEEIAKAKAKIAEKGKDVGVAEPLSKRPRLDKGEDDGEAAAEKNSALFRSGGAEQMAAEAAAGKPVAPSSASLVTSNAGSSASANNSIPKPLVPFEALLRRHTMPSTSEDYLSPVTRARGVAINSRQVLSFPRYCWVVLNRYITGEDWLPKKIDASVPMPLVLDFAALAPGYKVGKDEKGLRPGEQDLDQLAAAAGNTSSAAAPAAAAAATIMPDAGIVSGLLEMQFPEGACKRACVATGNAGLEQAMEWIMAHMDDADFAEPYIPAAAAPAPASSSSASASASSSFDPELLMQLTSMGFDEERAQYALKQASGSIERAADWLFSHMDEPLPSASPATGGAGAGGAGSTSSSSSSSAFPTAADYASSGRYGLVGFISHMGTTTSSGHYVCHLHKDSRTGEPVPAGGASGSGTSSGEWFLFNDTRVMKSEAPPFDLGFVYLYQRLD